MKIIKLLLCKRSETSIVLFTIIIILLPGFLHAQTNWNIPKEAAELKNPLANNTTGLKDAKVLYTTNCVPCHGAKGKGDGAAASALNPKPSDHSSERVQKETDGELFWEISEGHNPMPEYKGALTETQRWELVNYIRTLTKTPKKQ
ncbi:c-type cytochrome [Segetibacter koreensis]|uniref:c-type cytochrome n=1 Tax=Segetibacter koreensis TaxID=398037 RepID=UPI00036193A5|nr:cytochrome c [Segetibacter koreensis]